MDKDTFNNVAVHSVTHALDKSQCWRTTRDRDEAAPQYSETFHLNTTQQRTLCFHYFHWTIQSSANIAELLPA